MVGDRASAVCYRAVRQLEINSIVRDASLQSRLRVDPSIVREYAQLMAAGESFPPVLVVSDGCEYWLSDGYHRTAARQLCGHATVLSEIRSGTRDDAIWMGCAANRKHGLRRSNADKKRAAERALLHPRAQRLSNRQIAHHCGVHHHTVGRLRSLLEAQGSIVPNPVREVLRAGSSYCQRVEGIAASNARRAGPSVVLDEPVADDAVSPACEEPIAPTMTDLGVDVPALQQIRFDAHPSLRSLLIRVEASVGDAIRSLDASSCHSVELPSVYVDRLCAQLEELQCRLASRAAALQ